MILTGIGGGAGDALTSNPLSQFAATTSLQLKNVISDETGSGALVFANTPTLVTPVLGAATGTSVVLTGAAQVGAGASTTPSIAIGATTTGFYSRSGGVIDFVFNGAAFNPAIEVQSNKFQMGQGYAFGWTSSNDGGAAHDTILVRDAANTVAQRNSTTAQVSRGYRTYTDSSNYERWALQTGSGYVQFAAETAGTGTDDLDVLLTPAGAGLVRFGTHSALASETVTGYITIKDAGGTSRKVAVVS